MGHRNGTDEMKSLRAIRIGIIGGVSMFGAVGASLAQPDWLVPPMPVGGKSAPVGVITQVSPPPAAAVAPQPAPPKEWSGESGSSGHPLMQSAAIRQAADARANQMRRARCRTSPESPRRK
jgi:hypothetical protein